MEDMNVQATRQFLDDKNYKDVVISALDLLEIKDLDEIADYIVELIDFKKELE